MTSLFSPVQQDHRRPAGIAYKATRNMRAAVAGYAPRTSRRFDPGRHFFAHSKLLACEAALGALLKESDQVPHFGRYLRDPNFTACDLERSRRTAQAVATLDSQQPIFGL